MCYKEARNVIISATAWKLNITTKRLTTNLSTMMDNRSEEIRIKHLISNNSSWNLKLKSDNREQRRQERFQPGKVTCCRYSYRKDIASDSLDAGIGLMAHRNKYADAAPLVKVWLLDLVLRVLAWEAHQNFENICIGLWYLVNRQLASASGPNILLP